MAEIEQLAAPTGATSRLALPYPIPDDSVDVPRDIQALATKLDPIVFTETEGATKAAFSQGLASARPAVGVAGRFYYATDTQALTYDNGAAWVTEFDPTAVNFLQGTAGSRPSAGIAGRFYYATDTTALSYDTGSAWLTVAPVPQLVTTTLPASPVDGQEVHYLADATNGIVWRLRYRAASASASKWEFVGGAALYSNVETSENTAATGYSTMTTAGPAITVPLAGDYIIEHGGQLLPPAQVSGAAWMSYSIGATAAVDADAVVVQNPTTTGVTAASVARVARKTLAAGTALTALYHVFGTSATFARRWMRVTPIRLT